MQHSETVKQLSAAFVKAQRMVEGAKKDKANPFFKSTYADLESVWEACRTALTANDLGVIQFPISSEAGVGVETVLVHASGEWMSEGYVLPFPVGKGGEVKVDAQAGCSCITYARRYALAALMGVCPEDDDGNAATAASRDAKQVAVARLKNASEQGLTAYKKAWQDIGQEMRQAIGPQVHEGFKATAAAVKETSVNGEAHAAAAV